MLYASGTQRHSLSAERSAHRGASDSKTRVAGQCVVSCDAGDEAQQSDSRHEQLAGAGWRARFRAERASGCGGGLGFRLDGAGLRIVRREEAEQSSHVAGAFRSP